MSKKFRIVHLNTVSISDQKIDYVATLLCDKCRSESVNVNFSMPGPEYQFSSSFGSFYGDNINLCIWYGGKFENKKWWFNSDFLNLCPNCFTKVFPDGYNGHVNKEELKNILGEYDKN